MKICFRYDYDLVNEVQVDDDRNRYLEALNRILLEEDFLSLSDTDTDTDKLGLKLRLKS